MKLEVELEAELEVELEVEVEVEVGYFDVLQGEVPLFMHVLFG